MFRLRKTSYLLLAFGLFTTMPKIAKLNASNNNINSTQLTNESFNESFNKIDELGNQLVSLLPNIQNTDPKNTGILAIIIKNYGILCIDSKDYKIIKATDQVAKTVRYAATNILAQFFIKVLNNKKIVTNIPTTMETNFNSKIDKYINQIIQIQNSLSLTANDKAFIKTLFTSKTFNNIKAATDYNKLCNIINALKASIIPQNMQYLIDPKNIQELITSAQDFYTNTIA